MPFDSRSPRLLTFSQEIITMVKAGFRSLLLILVVITHYSPPPFRPSTSSTDETGAITFSISHIPLTDFFSFFGNFFSCSLLSEGGHNFHPSHNFWFHQSDLRSEFSPGPLFSLPLLVRPTSLIWYEYLHVISIGSSPGFACFFGHAWTISRIFSFPLIKYFTLFVAVYIRTRLGWNVPMGRYVSS